MMKERSVTIKLKNIKVSAEDIKVIGSEPEWTEGDEVARVDLISALNWYNYAVDPRERPRLLAELYPQDAQVIGAVPYYRLTNALLAYSRMSKRGYVLTPEQQSKIDALLNQIREEGARILNKPKEASAAKPLTAAELDKRLLDRCIEDLEQEIDNLVQSGYKYRFNQDAWFKSHKPTSKCAEGIVSYYEPLLKELNEVANVRKDRELVQAYCNTTPKNLRKYHEFVNLFVEQARSLIKEEEAPVEKAAVVRKPRKKKAVDPKKLVSKLKYQDKDAELDLSSVSDVSKIVGASEIWAYNTKYRELSYYKASAKGSLSLKGQTILGYDENLSIKKKIRKPETLKTLIEQGSKTVYNDFIALKTSPSKSNGRINAFTLILRINK
jgi:hypothetical protein